MYKKICMGLLLCAGTVFGMDDMIDTGVWGAPCAFGGLATPPGSPGGRRISTPGAPVKATPADRASYVGSLNQIFLETTNPTEKARLAVQVRLQACACLSSAGLSDNDAAALRSIIVGLNHYECRTTSPTLYAARPSGRALFGDPNDDELIGGRESTESGSDSDESM